MYFGICLIVHAFCVVFRWKNDRNECNGNKRIGGWTDERTNERINERTKFNKRNAHVQCERYSAQSISMLAALPNQEIDVTCELCGEWTCTLHMISWIRKRWNHWETLKLWNSHTTTYTHKQASKQASTPQISFTFNQESMKRCVALQWDWSDNFTTNQLQIKWAVEMVLRHLFRTHFNCIISNANDRLIDQSIDRQSEKESECASSGTRAQTGCRM